MGIYYLPGPIIPAGEHFSNAIDCGGNSIIRIVMPDGWNTAPLTFQLSPDGQVFNDLFCIQDTNGSFVPYEAIVPVVHPGVILVMPPNSGHQIFWIRFRSGTSNLPVNQSEERKFRTILHVEDAPAGRADGKEGLAIEGPQA
jgi:hypothetical protein